MRLVLSLVSLLVVLVVGGFIARSQLRASQPLLGAVAGASGASGPMATASEPTGIDAGNPVAVLINSSASGATEPTPQQQKQFMESLSKIMQQKPAADDTDGK